MSDSLTITLAGQDYTVQPFTMGQLEDIQDALRGSLAPGADKDTQRKIIAIALSVDHPTVTVESLRVMRVGTIDALRKSFRAVMTFGGWEMAEPKPAGDPSAGETPGA